MWRMSSPGLYSRCWTNSTDEPKNGLLCMPEMNPSTTCLARRSRRPTRASVHVWAAVEQGAGLGAENEVLNRPRAGAPTEPFADELGCTAFGQARLPYDRQAVADQVIAHRHLAHQLLQLQDHVAGQHRGDVL